MTAETVPMNDPATTSLKKCCIRYIRLYATDKAATNQNAFNQFLRANKANVQKRQNAVVVCPEGKLQPRLNS